VRGTSFPDASTNPRQRGGDQINDRADHKDLKRTVPFAQSRKKYAQRSIRKTKETPGDKAGDQQACRIAKKSQDGKESNKSDDSGGDEIALDRNAIENRKAIGDKNPSEERQRKTGSYHQADSYSGVFESVERFMPTSCWSNQHDE
jgi:hypothetical protein